MICGTPRRCPSCRSWLRTVSGCTRNDPQAMPEAKALLPESVLFFDEVYATLSGVDAVVLMTEWNAYRGMDLDRIKKTMRGQRIHRPAQRL